MANNKLFIVLVFLFNLAVALTEAPVTCYRIEPGTIAGIICADVLLTLVIVVVTYQCASYRHRKMDKMDENLYTNVRANCKR